MKENRGGTNENSLAATTTPELYRMDGRRGVKQEFPTGKQTKSVDPTINPVPMEDFHATMLQLLGFEHKKLNVPFQGLDQRLTGIERLRYQGSHRLNGIGS